MIYLSQGGLRSQSALCSSDCVVFVVATEAEDVVVAVLRLLPHAMESAYTALTTSLYKEAYMARLQTVFRTGSFSQGKVYMIHTQHSWWHDP